MATAQVWLLIYLVSFLFMGNPSFAASPQAPRTGGTLRFGEQLYNYDIAHSVGATWASLPEVNKGKSRNATLLEPNHALVVESYFGEKGGPFAVKLERMLIVRDEAAEVLDADLSLDEWMVA